MVIIAHIRFMAKKPMLPSKKEDADGYSEQNELAKFFSHCIAPTQGRAQK
jgi:hypothetical protein